YESFSLTSFHQVADEYAAFYIAAGVTEKDPIAVYLEEGVSNYLNLVALTSLGAIAVLINGAMRPEVAAEYMRRVGVVGAFVGEAQHAALAPHQGGLNLRFVATHRSASATPPGKLPAPYVHADDDACMLCHSSGTTGAPKPVIEQHGQFFEGTRLRLASGMLDSTERVLSTLPHSHSAGVSLFMSCVLNGAPILLASDYHASRVLPLIASFEPTSVVGFTRTMVELASADLSGAKLDSVRLWVNSGDAAHEKHIRLLVQHGHRIKDGARMPGSTFLDGFGSTEMSFALFQRFFTKETTDYGRSLGKPLPIAEAVVLAEDGSALPPDQPGLLGVRAPSITRGYWNESQLTYRSRKRGYWLTGDIVMRDGEGNFYHLDRITDVIRSNAGPIFTLPIEERLLQFHDDILDAAVFGVRGGDGDTRPMGVVLLKASSEWTEQALHEAFNRELDTLGLARVVRLAIAHPSDPWPVGPTGKVIKHALRDQFSAAAPATTPGAPPR
ncbi:MAG TPA: class I adenylate-forming enzyme family protein, partial [Kofleriaceae bacterium]|nr:class I adenylate-forming enzyme family protein [Kofleriaceae bacterium]